VPVHFHHSFYLPPYDTGLIFSATRNRALLDAGLRFISSGEETIALVIIRLSVFFPPHIHTGIPGGHTQPFSASRMKFFTIRSSRE
jgi:hypothetical protein